MISSIILFISGVGELRNCTNSLTAYLTLTTEHNLNRNINNEIIIAKPYSVYISALSKDFLSRTKSENTINYLKKI